MTDISDIKAPSAAEIITAALANIEVVCAYGLDSIPNKIDRQHIIECRNLLRMLDLPRVPNDRFAAVYGGGK